MQSRTLQSNGHHVFQAFATYPKHLTAPSRHLYRHNSFTSNHGSTDISQHTEHRHVIPKAHWRKGTPWLEKPNPSRETAHLSHLSRHCRQRIVRSMLSKPNGSKSTNYPKTRIVTFTSCSPSRRNFSNHEHTRTHSQRHSPKTDKGTNGNAINT